MRRNSSSDTAERHSENFSRGTPATNRARNSPSGANGNDPLRQCWPCYGTGSGGIIVLRGGGERMKRFSQLLTALLLITTIGSAAFAQPLTDAAAERLARARATAQQPLATYPAQYPDRPLWQETFAYIEEAISLAPSSPEPYRFQAIAHTMANWYGPAWRM